MKPQANALKLFCFFIATVLSSKCLTARELSLVHYEVNTFAAAHPLPFNAIKTCESSGLRAIRFPPIPPKRICDPDFDPMATSSLPITYTSSEPDVADIINGKIHFYGPGAATITASNGVETATQLLTVSNLQKPYAIVSTSTVYICEGSTVSFHAATDNAGANPSYIWLINDVDVANNNATYTTNSLTNGDRISLVVTNNDYCIPLSAQSNQIIVEVTPYTAFSVEIAANTTDASCAGSAVTFTAQTRGNSNTEAVIKWFVNDQQTNQIGSTFTSTMLKDEDVISCQAFGSGSCLANAIAYSNFIRVAVRNDCEILLPNSFSPNGDGVNDYWQIKAIGNTDLVQVFNRNGSIIFQSRGYAIPWDGTLAGKTIPVGTYFYLITANGGTKKLSGSVTLFR
ncbi:hypothetical protein DBR40_01685 [Pedobacter sp. KBW01]|uniref:gliding motility-associated C-terminal domain-containing protein n=1 Tax=Pedobacter sp. KBW01 TaxID=2153364 RepID=UPI000F5A1D48|nr:gliding motility-associated C-terminal domain-containing protein [Pedobacter sp. KBW01]RQO79695.1 hypothetical protein DBR40_01685 [Pedobacter sp. KBW01]